MTSIEKIFMTLGDALNMKKQDILLLLFWSQCLNKHLRWERISSGLRKNLIRLALSDRLHCSQLLFPGRRKRILWLLMFPLVCPDHPESHLRRTAVIYLVNQ